MTVRDTIIDIKTLPNKLFIGGKWIEGEEKRKIAVINPFDNSNILDIAEATEPDVNKAVAAARDIFPEWKTFSGSERASLLSRLADLIEKHFEELAELESLDTGHPFRDTKFLDVPRTILNFRYFAGLADKIDGRQVPVETGFLNVVKKEPVGVVGQIVPWNFPLMFCSWKLAPALACGNTVVLKPSELTPLTTLKLGELISEVGFPPGVVNIVPGYGMSAGKRLAQHPDVAKIAFTGSTSTGKEIVKMSAGNLKRLSLELGGKGANIVFDDASLDSAIGGSAFAIFHNQGQACIAGSRLLLQESIADEFLDGFIDLAKSIKLGDPLDPETEMGPLTSHAHHQKVLQYLDICKLENNKILYGGTVPKEEVLKNGFFVQPTIVEAKSRDRVFREEVFGPFVSVTKFKDESEAIALANDSPYGLGSGLWTSDLARAHRVADALDTGMVWINCYKRVHPASPFGGVGQSGYGKDLGRESIDEYTNSKSIWINYDAKVPPFYRR
jgi:aldehyde dehydrogenase (NAD+)